MGASAFPRHQGGCALTADVRAFTASLAEGGLREALRYLNRRTPHRYTGVYRFDGDMIHYEVGSIFAGATLPRRAENHRRENWTNNILHYR